MKKGCKKWFSVILSLILLCTIVPVFSINVSAFSSSRDDGTWLFPLPSGYYNSFTDWAGCPGNGKCVFCGVYHSGWGDSAHTGQGGHNGIDIGAPAGTNVYSSAAGRAYRFYTSVRGNTVVIEHAIGNGYSYYTYYQHLSSISINNGSNVNAGTIIGKVGNTGQSEGNHLHFGMVMGTSNQMVNNDLLNSLESKGWITSSGYRSGRILNNPASNNDAGFPKGYSAVVPPLKSHYGSVHYTFNISKVSLKAPAVHTHSYKKAWFWASHPHYNEYKCSCGASYVDRNSVNYYDKCSECKKPKIKDGVYRIAIAENTNYGLDVKSGLTNDRQIVQLWQYVGVDQQKVYFKYVGDGYYTIQFLHSKKLLDVSGGSGASGTTVWQYIPNNSNAQLWTLLSAGSNSYYLKSKCGNVFLDLLNNSVSNGNKVWTYEPNYSAAQKWSIIPVECNHNYKNTGNVKASYFKTGLKVYQCSKCNYKKNVIIPKLALKATSFSLKSGRKLFKISYKKVSGASGYQVKYKIGKKTVVKTYYSSKAAVKKYQNLKAGTYKVKFRAFRKSGSKTLYSKWSKIKSVKVRG